MRVVLGLVICGGAITALASAATPGTPGYIGLLQPYTYHTGCGGGPVDPLNVVWFGSYATTTHVAAGLVLYGGWNHDDYKSPAGVDTQAVQETPASGGCVRDHVQRADDCAICDRNHIRLFPTASNGAIYVTGDAHHDAIALFYQGCTKAVVAGHYASDFNGPRDRIVSFWPGGAIHYDDWANTRSIKQCNGSFPHSDGFVAVMRATNIG
jgi:hypothetical protein